MRTRGFAIAMGIAFSMLVPLCVWLGVRFWRVYQLRQAFPRAVSLYNDGKLEEALPYLDRAIGHAPQKLEPYRLAALICTRLQQPERAAEYFAALLQHAEGAEKAEAHLRLAALTLEDPKATPAALEEAIAHAEAAAEAYQQHSQPDGAARALVFLLEAQARRGDTAALDAALDRLAELASNTTEAPVLSALHRWRLARKLRGGDVGDLVEAWNLYKRLPPDRQWRNAIGLALAFHAADPALSSSVRRLCLDVLGGLPQPVREGHEATLHLVASMAWQHLDRPARALEEARKGHKLAPTEPRVRRALARALFTAAEGASDPARRKELEDEGVRIYQNLLASGKLTGEEHRRLSLALLTRHWARGQTEQAEALLRSLGDVDAPAVERIRALRALQQGDYNGLATHLRRARELAPDQPDVAALLDQLQTPPAVDDFRANQRHRYDPRPILAASFHPRAIPEPIPADRVAMSLDGSPVQPIVTRGECFFRPAEPLEPGDHKMELIVTDTLGLQTTRSFSFRIEEDAEGPQIVGIRPEPESRTTTLAPLVAFRCTDPSGIDPRSLTVVFRAQVGQPPRASEFTVIRAGVYQVPITKLGIARGARVEHGLVRFQRARPLAPGPCQVRVTVADTKGNRTTREWSFECSQ